jgi:hypothetical protein
MPISFHHKCVLMTVGFLPVLWRPIATAWPTTTYSDMGNRNRHIHS